MQLATEKDPEQVTETEVSARPQEVSSFCDKPRCLLTIVVVAIFISEALLMLALAAVEPLPLHIQALLDALLLVIIIFPAMYFLVLKPMRANIAARQQAAEQQARLVIELQKALTEVKTLSGMLPICSSCKKIRDDQGYWNQIEKYFSTHSEVNFTHGICPDCVKKLYPEFADEPDLMENKPEKDKK